MGGYSLWGPLIDNLAQLGYDHNSLCVCVAAAVLSCSLHSCGRHFSHTAMRV